MLSDSLYDFISGRKHLIWYVKDYRALNEEAVVEATLNYGNWDDVQKLIRILGMEKVAQIFRKQMVTGRQRGNYYPETAHYFTLYFNKYVPLSARSRKLIEKQRISLSPNIKSSGFSLRSFHKESNPQARI
ncbi:MAG: hypothetical protein Q7S08_02330 [bacterium]|nr:hypothetical protein [bacterium]